MRPLISSLTRRDVLLLALVVALVAALTAAFWDYTQDDVFITFVYSRNLAEGEGFVFNPGERVQGTTTPLYALLLAGVYRITPDLLHAGNVLSALFLLAAIGLAVRLTRCVLSWAGRGALALLLAVSPLVYVSFGMETLFYTALLLLALWLWAQDRRAPAMLAAAALTWTRADGVVLAGTFGLIALWESVRRSPLNWRDLPWRLALVYLAGIAPWFLFAWAYFGTPLPQTFSAKEEFLQGIQFWRDGVGWWRSFYGSNPIMLLALPLAGVGLWRAWMVPPLRPLALWPLLYLLGYIALNVTAFWYYTPLLAVLIVLAALGGDWLAAKLIAAGWPRRAVTIGALALVGVAVGLAALRAGDYRDPPPRMATYRLAGEWIDRHAPLDLKLMVKDLGIAGYYARRHTLDSFGLIVPEMYFPQDDYANIKFKPDWTVTTQYWEMQRLVEQDWFRAHYVPLAQFSTPGDDAFSPMTVYARRLPLETPPAAIQGFDLPLTCPVTLAEGDPLPAATHARLLDTDGAAAAEVTRPFLWGRYPAARAAAPETLIEQIALPLAVMPGRYTWELACGDATLTGAVEVRPVAQADGYTAITGAEWAGFAQLRGVILPEGAETWSGGSLAVALDWAARGSAEQDLSLFLHLVAPDGRVLAQADGYPRAGERPTSSWRADETILDVRRVLLPPDLPAGDYTLRLGWYDWRTDERLPLDAGGDALDLPLTIHNRWPGGSGLP
ncbi:MAG: hypothetical protein GXY36_18095 [Chloroflexi bacterium]|nr:hypothetical protein [Chloroflexota bacterium]